LNKYNLSILSVALLLGLVLPGEPACTQGDEWQEIPLPAGVQFIDMVFLDENTGWAVGLRGKTGESVLFHTVDGALTWNEQTTGLPDAIWTKLTWADLNIGFVIGFNASNQSLLLRTNDGGQSWKVNTPPISGQFSDLTTQPGGGLWALSAIYKPCCSYYIWHSISGETWSEKSVSPLADAHVTEITFPTAEIGYAVGWSESDVPMPLLMKTRDGGNTWVDVPQLLATGSFLGEFFLDDLNGYICGSSEDFGVILKTADGGSTWTEVARLSGSSVSIRDLVMANPLTGFAFGVWESGEEHGMSLYETMDGNNWVKSSLSLPLGSTITLPVITNDKAFTAFNFNKENRFSIYVKRLPPYTPPRPTEDQIEYLGEQPAGVNTPADTSSCKSSCGTAPLPIETSLSLLTLTFGTVYFVQRKIAPPKN